MPVNPAAAGQAMTTKEVLGWAFNASGLEVLISVFANDAQAQGVLAQVELENPSALTTSLLKNHSKAWAEIGAAVPYTRKFEHGTRQT